MVKFVSATKDQLLAARKETMRDDIVLKGFRAPASWDDKARSARFVMSSQAADRYGDIVVQEGIATEEFERNPQALLFHQSRAWPIGQWSELEKILTGRPPRMEGTLTFLPEGDIEEADKAALLVKRGVIRAVSIGFVPRELDLIMDDDDEWTGGYRFLTSELVETSVVPIPAQPKALVKDAGGNMKLARDLLEHVLDTWTKTAEGLIVPRAGYERAHREATGRRTVEIIAQQPQQPPPEPPPPPPPEPPDPEPPDAAAAREASFMERVMERVKAMLGGPVEPPPPAPPSAEAIAAAKSKAAEVAARLRAKGI